MLRRNLYISAVLARQTKTRKQNSKSLPESPLEQQSLVLPQYRFKTSSELMRRVQLGFLQWPDAAFTIPRWGHLSIDLAKRNGLHPTSQGPMIDFTSEHHVFTFIFISAVTFMAAAAGVECWKEEKFNAEVLHEKNKINHENNHFSIQAKFNEIRKRQKITMEEFIENLNLRIHDKKNQTDAEKKFFAKFENAVITVENDEIVVNFSTNFDPIKALMASLDGIFLPSVWYWVLWIGAVIATGKWMASVPDIADPISLGGAFGIGVITYFIPKVYHWYQHRYTPEGKIKTAEEAAQGDLLLEYTLGIKKEFSPITESNHHTLYLIHAAAVGLITGLLKSQYCLWPVSVIFPVITNYTNELGIFSLFVGFALSYKAYRDKVNELDNAIELTDTRAFTDTTSLQNEIHRLNQVLAKYRDTNENELIVFFEKLGKKERAIFATLAYLFYDFVMTAAFIARVGVIPGVTSSFIPVFLHLATLTATLSNPASYAIIFGSAAIWAAFRCYVRYQENVEKRLAEEKSKDTPSKYDDLEAQRIVLQNRVNNIEKTVSSIPRFNLGRFGMFSSCCERDDTVNVRDARFVEKPSLKIA